MRNLCLAIVVTLLGTGAAGAGEVRVAVAANFQATLKKLVAEFEGGSDHRVSLSPGSTGRLYAQIINGAPYDVFLAADAERPLQLEQSDRIEVQRRFDYALGELVLLSAGQQPPPDIAAWLASDEVTRIAIANPRHAPYGRAAQEFLDHLDVADEVAGKLVFGESVGQALQFVASGNATAGLVARAQVNNLAADNWRPVPAAAYAPILQQGVLLTDSEAARSFVEFLKGTTAAAIMERDGYRVPPARSQ